MDLGTIIIFAVLVILALASWVIAYFQHKEKGILFNNAYIYASKAERRQMNKKPYYKQSKVVFILAGAMFFSMSLGMVLLWVGFFWISMGLALLTIVYAIASSVQIERQRK